MVVDDLDFRRPGCGPDEAHPPLVVHSDAMLSLPITLERFEAVARRRTKELQSLRGMKLRELPLGDASERSEPLDRLALEQCLRVLALEREDHGASVLRRA